MEYRDPVVAARDAGFHARGYRSFEFASFEASAGEVVALLSVDARPARDLALAVAGIIRPSSGSLQVCGAELARGKRAARLARGCVGMGAVRGLEPAGTLTVEEALAREASLKGRAGDWDLLDFLAEFELATHVDQRVESLSPAARARMSAALACAGDPAVAVVDLTDPFCAGLDAAGAVDVAALLLAAARRHSCALVAATTEPAFAAAASSACALGIDAAEALERARGEAPAAHDAAPCDTAKAGDAL